MYRVEVVLHVHSCFASVSTLDEWLHKEFTLPFPPFKGLTVVLDDSWQCTIEDKLEISPIGHESINNCQIVWDIQDQKFKVYLPSHKEIYWAQLAKREHRGLKEIVDSYIEDGWERKEI